MDTFLWMGDIGDSLLDDQAWIGSCGWIFYSIVSKPKDRETYTKERDCFRYQITTLNPQVQVSNWEPSFQLHELLGGGGKDSFGTADLFERVQLIQKPTAVNVKHLAYQLFNKMLLSSRREQYNNQQLKISKSWHFKFKTKATRESSHANLLYNETIEAGDTKDIKVEQLILAILGQ